MHPTPILATFSNISGRPKDIACYLSSTLVLSCLHYFPCEAGKILHENSNTNGPPDPQTPKREGHDYSLYW